MPTIGRRYHGPTRNYATSCDYCGVMWHRHELTANDEGLLACPDDRDGKTAKSLNDEISVREPIQIRGKTRD